MKEKRIMSFMLAMCMVLSFVSNCVFAAETDSITVNVSIVQNGQFVTGKNETKLACVPIIVTDRDGNGSYEIDEALYAAHEVYYEGGAENGYSSEATEYGLSLTKLWGDDSEAFGYYKNDQYVGSLADAVNNGDSVCAFVYQDKTGWSDKYTYFEEDTASVKRGQILSVKLNKLEYDANWELVVLPVENATITIDEVGTEITTNAEGVAEIIFDNAGIYTLSAITNYTIVPSVSIVTVLENDDEEDVAPPNDDKSDEGNSDIPPTTEGEVDYKAEINTILENIANLYKNSVSDWIAFPEWYVMDMGAYEGYNSETANKLSDSTKQDYVNYAVNAINEATSDTAIDKAVLGLVAIGKNPEQLYFANSSTPISAIEKLNTLAKSASVWAAPYTLAVYNQGEYETDTYETELVDALLASQLEDGSWNEYDTVIDTTANAIVGLSFYRDIPEVDAAIAKALGYLSAQQSDTGSFGENANSTAMVAVGLCAAGVDLEKDDDFIKDGNNIIDGLLTFALADNSGFGYKNNQSMDNYATEQSFRALVAIMQTLKSNEAYNIYDFSKNNFTAAYSTENKYASNVSGSGGGGGGSSSASTKNDDKNTENKTDENDNIDEEKEKIDYDEPTANIVQYTDIKTDDWYYNDVKKAIEIGLFNGVSQTLFSPDEGMTRGMLVTVLYRYDGEKGAVGKTAFADCLDNEWYSEAVYWASENNIVSGYGNGMFGTEDLITRQQLVTILYRYAGEKTETDLSGFADAEEIEDWAKDAIMWAVETGIVLGSDDNMLNPNGYATRAETAAIFIRYINMLTK